MTNEKRTTNNQNNAAPKPKMPSKKLFWGLEHWQFFSVLLVVYDILVANFAYFVSLWIRFDCEFSEIPTLYLDAFIRFAPIYSVVVFLVCFYLKLYRSMWRFSSVYELNAIINSTLLTTVFHVLGTTLLFQRMPISYYICGPLLQFIAVVFARFAYRYILILRKKWRNSSYSTTTNVMLIGAGMAGQAILRDVANRENSKERVRCIIDDNSNKWNRHIDGVPIVGGRYDIPKYVEKYKIDKIYFCVPSATAAQRRDILEICKGTGCAIRTLMNLYQMTDRNVTINSMQDISVEDLLGREPVMVQMDEIFQFITGKVILVTGGGGSIGSELCRQIASHNPKQLIIFDIYENNAYAIGLELRRKFPNLDLKILIGSVRDSMRICQIFSEFKPEIVYHAAAHKHVPLMEDSPCEAIKNNAIGTYKTAYAAVMNGCKRFVLISTDKAVNPTNIMGASKRICELVIQAFNQKAQDGTFSDIHPIYMHSDSNTDYRPAIPDATFNPITDFVAVRFGNVLASNGSVIPLFKEQIARGGPVTVTHPDIIRYFMTIPEATSLVLQAGTYAKGGEVFVLDMGSPVKIDTLARNLICLSGLKPDVDIPIIYTGLRPGEKLYEEKLMSEEGLRKTPNNLIHIGNPLPLDADKFLMKLQELMELAYDGQEEAVRNLIAEIVPTYHTSEEDTASVSTTQCCAKDKTGATV